MTIKALAIVALVLYSLYAVGFHLEGLKTQGSVGLKILAALAEASFLSVLIWTAW